MAIANLPMLSPLTNKDGTINHDWVSWLRTVWQRVSEPWRYNAERGGAVALVAGEIEIINKAVKSSSFIQMTAQGASANAGFLSVAIVDKETITITSSNALDTRVVFWEIRESL